jgi:hypothetical protein
MAVAHETATESHTGTTGSTSEASFDTTVPFTGSSAGLLVFVGVVQGSHDTGIDVKIDPSGTNTDVPTIILAEDTIGEIGSMETFFLGTGLPSSSTTVRVNRTNNTKVLYAVCITVTAGANTGIFETGIVLLEESSDLTEQSVDDDSPGENSVRYAGTYWGANNPPDPGSNSTALQSIDLGSQTFAAVRETTAGQGSRSIGFNTGAFTDDRAAIHLAVTELAGDVTLAGMLFSRPPAFISGVITSARSLVGVLFSRPPTFITGVVISDQDQVVSGGLQTDTILTVYGQEWFTDIDAGFVITDKGVFPVEVGTGVPFSRPPTFIVGLVSQGDSLVGVLFTRPPSFITGVITSNQVVAGALFSRPPAFISGIVSGVLTGVLFSRPPTFIAGGIVIGTQVVVGELFFRPPSFISGVVILAGAGTFIGWGIGAPLS